MTFALRSSVSIFRSTYSRLAIKHGSARGKAMRGGFTFKLSSKWWRPPIQVRHLNARASLMQFTHPPKRRDLPCNASGRFRPASGADPYRPEDDRRGPVQPVIFARVARRLPEDANAQGGKRRPWQATDAKDIFGYAVQDVQVTWECYQALRDRYALHALEETPMGKILSEASLGKAYLRQMGVRPFREVQPDFPPQLIGMIMSTYFGGRAEVRWRREIRQVLYCDFLSMYPTVCALMGLWRFVIAQGMEWRDATEETRTLVNSISLEKLQRPDFWPRLTTLVRVKPQADIFPVRAPYDEKSQTIGLNYLSADFPALVHARRRDRREIAWRKIAGNSGGDQFFAERAADGIAVDVDCRQSQLSR